MQKIALFIVGIFALIIAAYMWLTPEHWYQTVPGVQETGPLNLHFARDVGLAFLSSGIALVYAVRLGDARLAFFGASWLIFHALFHLWIWLHRGMPMDLIAFTNFAGILLPAVLALWAAMTFPKEEMPS